MNTLVTIKICSKCKIEKPIEMFFKSSKEKDGLRHKCKKCVKLYYESNKEKILEYTKVYYESNKEKILEKVKAYNRANKNIKAEYQKEYQKENAKQIKEYRELRAEKIADRQKIYRQTPIGRASIKNSMHKRREIERKSDITSQQILILEQSTKICYWCHEPLKNKLTHIDHYDPLSKGGKHTLSNLVVACAKCNQSKSAKDPIEFANSIGRLL